MAPNRCCRFLPSPQGMRKKTICVFFCAGAWRPVPHEREKTIGARLQKKTLGARVVPPVGRRKRSTTLMLKKLHCKKNAMFSSSPNGFWRESSWAGHNFGACRRRVFFLLSRVTLHHCCFVRYFLYSSSYEYFACVGPEAFKAQGRCCQGQGRYK